MQPLVRSALPVLALILASHAQAGDAVFEGSGEVALTAEQFACTPQTLSWKIQGAKTDHGMLQATVTAPVGSYRGCLELILSLTGSSSSGPSRFRYQARTWERFEFRECPAGRVGCTKGHTEKLTRQSILVELEGQELRAHEFLFRAQAPQAPGNGGPSTESCAIKCTGHPKLGRECTRVCAPPRERRPFPH
jgi:hypothetical protein